MDAIFELVYLLLKWVSERTGLSYNEVNIVAYYILLPFAYVFLADRIWKKHVLKTAYVAAVTVSLLLIDDFARFSDWLFQKSVQFLLSFEVLGWNYVAASVLICVVFPGLVFVGMFHRAYPDFLAAVGRKLLGNRQKS